MIFISSKKIATKISLEKINTSRDFTYVKDTVRAFEKSLKCKNFGEVINIGSNFTIKIFDIIKLCSLNLQIKKKIVIDKKKLRPKKSEVMKLISSNTKAKKLLKWKPNFNSFQGFKKALGLTIDWYRNNPNFYKNYSKKII